MLNVATEIVAKGNSSRFKLKQQITRTTSTLFWCLTSHKVTPFLVFLLLTCSFLAKKKHICSEPSRRLPAESEQ